MSWLHYFYLMRWAVRNDPAIGYVMVWLALPVVVCWDVRKELMREMFPRLVIEAVIWSSAQPNTGTPGEGAKH